MNKLKKLVTVKFFRTPESDNQGGAYAGKQLSLDQNGELSGILVYTFLSLLHSSVTALKITARIPGAGTKGRGRDLIHKEF